MNNFLAKFFIIAVLGILAEQSFAFNQDYEWDWARKSENCSGFDMARSIAVDGKGGVYTVGTFENKITFGNETLEANYKTAPFGLPIHDYPYIVKYDTLGNFQWARGADNVVSRKPNDWSPSQGFTGVTVDTAGYIYAVGFFTADWITFGSTTLYNHGMNLIDSLIDTLHLDSLLWYPNTADICIVKYDPDGNVVWARNPGGKGSEYALNVTADRFGNIYMTGSFYSDTVYFGSIMVTKTPPLLGGNMFLAKYNGLGDALWVKHSTGVYEYARGVSVDRGGNAFVTGEYYQGIAFDTIVLAAPSVSQYVVKYTTDGHLAWAKSATGLTSGMAITADGSGNIYATGYCSGPVVLFGTVLLTAPIDQGSSFLVKYDPDGTALWGKIGVSNPGRFASNGSWSTTVDHRGNIWIGGALQGDSATFDTVVLKNKSTFKGHFNIFLVSYDANGNVLWGTEVPGTGGLNIEASFSLCSDSADNIYTAGRFDSEIITFDGTTLHHTPPPPNVGGPTDCFVAKLHPRIAALPAIATAQSVEYTPGCAGDSIDVILLVRDTSDASLRLDSIHLAGTDAGNFRILSPQVFPATMPSRGSMNVVLRFFGTGSPGIKNAQLKIFSNDKSPLSDTLTVVTLRGNVLSPVQYQLNPPARDLGIVNVHRTINDSVTFVNRDIRTLHLSNVRFAPSTFPGTIDMSSFSTTVDSMGSTIIKFSVNIPDTTVYNGTICVSVDSPCVSEKCIPVKVEGARVCFSPEAGVLGKKPGEEIIIPLLVSPSTKVSTATQIDMTVHYDNELLKLTVNPTTPLPAATVSNVVRSNGEVSFIVTTNGALPAPEAVIAELHAKALLASHSTGTIEVTASRVTLNSGNKIDGENCGASFSVDNSCVNPDDLGPRSSAEIEGIYPNPSYTETAIVIRAKNNPRVRVEIYDAFGREVEVLSDDELSDGKHEIAIHTKNYTRGMYFCRMIYDKRVTTASFYVER